MQDNKKHPCKYCGAVFDLAKAVRLDTETGEYEYACPHCAVKTGR